MKKCTIYFANHAQFEGSRTNLGDWAIFEQMIAGLKNYIKIGKCEVVLASSEPEFTMKHYPVYAFRRGGIRGILNTLKWIFKSDVVVIGGGEIVQDLSSLVYIPYQLMRPYIASLFGKKLFGYAIGIGTEYEISKIGRLQASWVLNKFDIITVRDKKSKDMLENFLKVKKPKIYLTADPALNLASSDEFYEKEKFCVVSVRSIYHRTRSILPFSIRRKLNMLPKEYYKRIKQFQKEIASLAEKIIDEYGLHIKFLNTYCGKSMSAEDDIFTNKVINNIDDSYERYISIINPASFPCQVKEILSKSEFVISVPLHPLILGAAGGVPVISIAYASKSSCFMQSIGMEEYTHEVINLNQKIDKGMIFNNIDEILRNHSLVKDNIIKACDSLKEEEKNNLSLLLELCGMIEG